MTNLPKVKALAPFPYPKIQCMFPASKLSPGTVGYSGYRERRMQSRGGGFTIKQCMNLAQWTLDDKYYCSRHAGLIILEQLDGR
jgi:hypothetical protein